MVELGCPISIIGILLAIGIPAMSIVWQRKAHNTHVNNLRNIGIALVISANENPEDRFPATLDGVHEAKSSTDVFNYLITLGVLKDKSSVYTPTDGKVAPSNTKASDLTADNVCVNYMVNRTKGKTRGVKQNVEGCEFLPLLWSSGNAPLVVKSGADLEVLTTGARKQAGAAVYYCNNTAYFKKAKDNGNDHLYIGDFIPKEFKPGAELFEELKP
ncbi:MAG: hypothetical protein ACAI35_16445 [Candidatus Methylacidiphilales bacterium]|nr:hypothetical protein [Candidatus Methylacidiphilales bacterium]